MRDSPGSPRTRIPVLLYHRIAAGQTDRFAVEPGLFAEHVAVIAASGRTPLMITEVADALRGERELPSRPMAITFDDGFEHTPAALRTLVEHDLRATLFVTAGALGRPGALTPDQLIELSAAGDEIELGAHSVTHPHLDAVNAPAMRMEVGHSKRILEQVAGRPIHTFAYPHGAYDERVRSSVIDAGFRSAAAVKNAISHDRDDPWAIARYTVTGADGPERLEQILSGRGVRLAWRRQRLRTRAARALRRTPGLARLAREPDLQH